MDKYRAVRKELDNIGEHRSVHIRVLNQTAINKGRKRPLLKRYKVNMRHF